MSQNPNPLLTCLMKLYSHLSFKNESTTSMVNPMNPNTTSFSALTTVLKRAHTSRSNFDWSSYLPAPSAPLSQLTEIPLNPYIPPTKPCVFGCTGHLCKEADGCTPDLLCKNNVCQKNAVDQPGQIGAKCNSKKPCQSHLRCSNGTCAACAVRPSLPLQFSLVSRGTESSAQNNKHGLCAPDALTLLSHPSPPPLCLSSVSSSSQNPCETPAHCSSTHYCSWGLCVRCKPTDLCLGSPCKSNAACKTGLCNEHGRCDYAGQKKLIFGPGIRGRFKNNRVDGVPRGHERGPAKVRSEALRVVIPTEGVMETGAAAAGVVS